MKTTTREEIGVAIVNLTGNIIGQAVPQVRRAIFTQIDSNETPRILINIFEHFKTEGAAVSILARTV